MAIHVHNTPSGVDEPGLPPAGLLRSRGASCRILTHGEMLALLDGNKPELPPEPLLAADDRPTAGQTSGSLARHRGARGRMPTHEGVVATTPYPSPIEGVSTPSTPADLTAAPKLPDLGCVDIDMPEADRHDFMTVQAGLDLAQTRHARRALYDALEHGFALIDAIGLSPLALDVIDDGIAALDRMDAPDEDMEDDGTLEEEPDAEDNGDKEPWLGAPEVHDSFTTRVGGRWCVISPDQQRWAAGGSDDRELEVADEPHGDEGEAEPSLGWPEDITAKLDDALQADSDPEADDSDLEDGFDPSWAVLRPRSTLLEVAL